MSKDTIEVNMNVYDIPIVIEALEKANKEIERLKEENRMLKAYIDQLKQYIVIADVCEWFKGSNLEELIKEEEEK